MDEGQLMNRRDKVFEYLQRSGIGYECHEHPAAPTVEIAMRYWADIPGVQHCKNLFFRNHKGDRHYLVIFDCSRNLAIRDLEQRLKQGKLSFASEERMMKYLGLSPGSVSLFGLINDTGNQVHLFLDKNLEKADKLSFHPNDNTASLVITGEGFRNFLTRCGNSYEYIALY
jgi:Ala-tRNA(Pro) deacylase